MVWCGVVWCGGMWCGVMWCGMVVKNQLEKLIFDEFPMSILKIWSANIRVMFEDAGGMILLRGFLF